MNGLRYPGLAAFLLILPFGQLLAQEDPAAASGKPNWKITPTASVDLTYTDNVSPGRGSKANDFITRLAPGINIEGTSARASGKFSYQWQQNLYADNSRLDNDQQSLRANGKLELVEQWLFIDATGSISQQAVSPFGLQGVGNELVNANRTETTSWQFSPYIKGRLAGYADYELRHNLTQTSAKTGVLAQYGDTSNQTWIGKLGGATPLAPLSWSLTAERQSIEVGSRPEQNTERMIAGLGYMISPQLRLQFNAGRESDNFNLATLKRRGNLGYGVEWNPTERTQLALKQDRRSYGTEHNFSFSHRTALSAWRYSDSRSVSLPAQQLSQAPVSSAYYSLYLQLSSAYPDPAERAAATLQMLQQLGISADEMIYGNLMTAQAFVQRRKEASVSLTGANNTVTLAVQRSDSSRLGTGGGLIDDFATTSGIRQSGVNGSWAHKLSPHSSLTLSALSSRSEGDNANQNTRLKSMSLMLSTKLGYRTSATTGVRHTEFDSVAGNSYEENALTGSLMVSF